MIVAGTLPVRVTFLPKHLTRYFAPGCWVLSAVRTMFSRVSASCLRRVFDGKWGGWWEKWMEGGVQCLLIICR